MNCCINFSCNKSIFLLTESQFLFNYKQQSQHISVLLAIFFLSCFYFVMKFLGLTRFNVVQNSHCFSLLLKIMTFRPKIVIYHPKKNMRKTFSNFWTSVKSKKTKWCRYVMARWAFIGCTCFVSNYLWENNDDFESSFLMI